MLNSSRTVGLVLHLWRKAFNISSLSIMLAISFEMPLIYLKFVVVVVVYHKWMLNSTECFFYIFSKQYTNYSKSILTACQVLEKKFCLILYCDCIEWMYQFAKNEHLNNTECSILQIYISTEWKRLP